MPKKDMRPRGGNHRNPGTCQCGTAFGNRLADGPPIGKAIRLAEERIRIPSSGNRCRIVICD